MIDQTIDEEEYEEEYEEDEEEYEEDNGSLYSLSEKTLVTLENLIKTKQIEIPVKISTLMDIVIGALVDSEVNEDFRIIEVFRENPELLFDNVEFKQPGEYNIHDVLGQVLCFRVMYIMQSFLDHINVEYETIEDVNIEE
jgi:hypothetical protein